MRKLIHWRICQEITRVGLRLSDECVDHVVALSGCRRGEAVDHEQQGSVVWAQFEYGLVHCAGVEEGLGSHGFRHRGFLSVCGSHVRLEHRQ